MYDDPTASPFGTNPAPNAQAEAQALARIAADFREKLPALNADALNYLLAVARLTLQWQAFLKGRGLDVEGTVLSVFNSDVGENIARKFVGQAPADVALPVPMLPPPELSPADQIEWSRGTLKPARTLKVVPSADLPPEHMTDAEKMSWFRARKAAQDGTDD